MLDPLHVKGQRPMSLFAPTPRRGNPSPPKTEKRGRGDLTEWGPFMFEVSLGRCLVAKIFEVHGYGLIAKLAGVGQIGYVSQN